MKLAIATTFWKKKYVELVIQLNFLFYLFMFINIGFAISLGFNKSYWSLGLAIFSIFVNFILARSSGKYLKEVDYGKVKDK